MNRSKSAAQRRTPKQSLSRHREEVNRAVRGIKRANARSKAKAESLGQEEIIARMSAVIAEQVGEKGTVSRDDFRRAGLPRAAVEANFQRALSHAREADPSLGKLEVVA